MSRLKKSSESSKDLKVGPLMFFMIFLAFVSICLVAGAFLVYVNEDAPPPRPPIESIRESLDASPDLTDEGRMEEFMRAICRYHQQGKLTGEIDEAQALFRELRGRVGPPWSWDLGQEVRTRCEGARLVTITPEAKAAT